MYADEGEHGGQIAGVRSSRPRLRLPKRAPLPNEREP